MKRNTQNNGRSKMKFTGVFRVRQIFLKYFCKTFARSIVNNTKQFVNEAGSEKSHEYSYARYILKYVEDPDFTNNCIREIARWIIEEKHENLMSTVSEFYSANNNFFIHTIRPGLWIGKGGSVIDSLIERLKAIYPNIEVRLVEENGSLSKLYSYYNTYNEY